MRIERFHIQGFKSIADVEVDGLSDINVFYGLNDVGKSNIFQAIALWNWLLAITSSSETEQFEDKFGPHCFPLKGDKRILLKVAVTLNQPDISGQSRSSANLIRAFGKMITPQDEIRLEVEANLGLQMVNPIELSITANVEDGQFPLSLKDLPLLQPFFHVIQATRRFQAEQGGKGNDLGPIGDRNLKRALFYAYLSPDPGQKRRLAAIRRTLAEPPFNLGELDVALDPTSGEIDIGFVRPEGRLPLENLGSGSQQLLMVLGQIFLNDYPIIAIEEPEMNLSPQYQQYLLVALRQLMQDPDVKLRQLFISSHSPYFEFEENFFDVTRDANGATQVARLPIEKRAQYFPDTQVGPETGARLNSFNQVKLYDGVIKDLGLQRGDLVLFTKNKAGRWEIRPEREITQELDAIFDDKEAQ
jgi:hypothetical protein